MKLTALMPARNEDWIIGLSLRVARLWCDEVIVLAHRCEDGTIATCDEAREEVGGIEIINESDQNWDEMLHRQKLLLAARERGATHIALIDADEVLTANAIPSIRERVEKLVPGACLQIPLMCMHDMGQWIIDAPSRHGRYITNWGNCITTAAFLDGPGLGWSVQKGGYQHHHREPFGAHIMILWRSDHGVMHFQFANRRRLFAKHALYKMVERLRWPDKLVSDIDSLYNLAVRPSRIHLRQVQDDWMQGYAEWLKYVDLDGEPWQEQECMRLWAKHGPEAFHGLNLFGVCEETIPA